MRAPGDEAVSAAARNNAEWCDIVCRTHGVPGLFGDDVWSVPRRSPPFYPDAVTIHGTASEDRVLASVDHVAPGCSVKDSFATLDLAPAGFHILFEAEWIWRSPDTKRPTGATTSLWAPVRDRDALTAWDAAWTDHGPPSGLFRPALLDHPDVVILGGYQGDRVVAGAILNRSGLVVGVSNLFSTLGDADDPWAAVLHVVDERFEGSPVVGYESGPELDAAHRHGFVSVGQLRVWMHDG